MQSPVERIEVSVANQELRLYREGELVQTFPISTSKFGTGTEEGSYKTPLGKFAIREKIGADEDEGTIFKSRKVEGKWEGEETDDDLVLTRILRLDGREDDNANTFDRYIYIHGTNQEHLIGSPHSWGCIRMLNRDVTALFDEIPEGADVEIIA